ncbi:MAG: nicotinate-nucleotide adenylyltransferase [Nitrospiraceae bacterium]
MTATTPPRHSSNEPIGIVGGTFNPIHRGHLSLAREIQTRLGFARMLFIPTGDPPHKLASELAPAADRLAMVRAAVAGEPAFDVSDIEVTRTGRSYTIDTLTALGARREGPSRFHLCLGLDSFLDVPNWRNASDLLAVCHHVVVSRPGVPFARLGTMPLLPAIDPAVLTALDTGRLDLAVVNLSPSRTLTLFQIPPCPISASLVRSRLAQGLSTDGLLPHAVEAYIIRRGLYQESPHPTRPQG